MPSCRRCGGELAQAELAISNWTEITRKSFYMCRKCGGRWLYSKSLNCPILIDDRNIKKEADMAQGRVVGTGRARGPGGRVRH